MSSSLTPSNTTYEMTLYDMCKKLPFTASFAELPSQVYHKNDSDGLSSPKGLPINFLSSYLVDAFKELTHWI